jgi:hypothetical protein
MSKIKETALPEVVEQPIQAEVKLKLSVDITVGAAFLKDIETTTAKLRTMLEELASGLGGTVTSMDVS